MSCWLMSKVKFPSDTGAWLWAWKLLKPDKLFYLWVAPQLNCQIKWLCLIGTREGELFSLKVDLQGGTWRHLTLDFAPKDSGLRTSHELLAYTHATVVYRQSSSSWILFFLNKL